MDKEVIINNHLDPVCGLYNGRVFIGMIENETALTNICAQIVQKIDNKEIKQSTYSVLYKEKYYHIEDDGHIHNVPIGFFDQYTNDLKYLFDRK